MILNLGDYPAGATVYVPFHTFSSDDPTASMTLTGLAITDIEIYRNGDTTQRSSDAGYTLLDTDGIDFDGITGLHGFSIDLSDNTDSGFYAAGGTFWVAVSSITVDGATINFWAAIFTIAKAGGVAAILSDTEALLTDTEAILVDAEAILADTESAITERATILTDAEAVLADAESTLTAVSSHTTTLAAITTDTEAILADTEGLSVAAILADTEALLTGQGTILADTEATQTAQTAILADTEASQTSEAAILSDTEASQTAETALLTDTEAVLTDAEAILTDCEAILADAEAILDDTGTAGVAVASATCNKIADHVRRRTQSNVESSSDGDTLDLSSEYGLIQQMQEAAISGTTLTVKKTDGSTTLGTKTVATDENADPITGVS